MNSEDSLLTNALKFAKLNGSNYRTWSFNIRLYLESLDLFEHVDGTAEIEVHCVLGMLVKRDW